MTELAPINFLGGGVSPAVVTPVSEPPVATVTPKPKRFRLVDEWHWVLNQSWSLRFVFLSFLLTCAEVILPLLNLQGIPGYPIILGLTTGAAFVARLIAQKREAPDGLE